MRAPDCAPRGQPSRAGAPARPARERGVSARQVRPLLGDREAEAARHAEEAVAWYRRAAEGAAPHPDAWFNLGLLHHEGRTVARGLRAPPDPAEARRCMEAAAALGDAAALYWLGAAALSGEARSPLALARPEWFQDPHATISLKADPVRGLARRGVSGPALQPAPWPNRKAGAPHQLTRPRDWRQVAGVDEDIDLGLARVTGDPPLFLPFPLPHSLP